jgi:hypothetical protein
MGGRRGPKPSVGFCGLRGCHREPTGDYYCDEHWGMVLELRLALRSYGAAKIENIPAEIEDYFL